MAGLKKHFKFGWSESNVECYIIFKEVKKKIFVLEQKIDIYILEFNWRCA